MNRDRWLAVVPVRTMTVKLRLYATVFLTVPATRPVMASCHNIHALLHVIFHG